MAGEGALKRAAPRSISPPPLRRKPDTLKKSVATSFFTPVSQRRTEPTSISWRIVNNTLIVGKFSLGPGQPPKQSSGKPKIAAFDFDSTLVATASGNTFPRDSADWKWWKQNVPSRLQKLNADGYHVVIFTNQGKISLKKDKKGNVSSYFNKFKERVSAVMKQLNIPLSVYAATEYDEYRKPRAGMWREFLDDYDFDVTGIDSSQSIFVGDAAGRPGDHSAADRGFAANANMMFKTPEEFFLDAAPEPVMAFDPAVYLQPNSDDSPASPPFSRESPLELVIFCGSPSAGKSTFFWDYLEPLGYERVNQDILKSRAKCIKVAKEHLAAQSSVVVVSPVQFMQTIVNPCILSDMKQRTAQRALDIIPNATALSTRLLIATMAQTAILNNTNADVETRAQWIGVAKEFNVPIRCVYFTAPPALCKHNNAVRAANKSLNPESRTLLPGIAFGDFVKRFKEPSLAEGFQDIVRVDFRFRGDDDAKNLWKQYWV